MIVNHNEIFFFFLDESGRQELDRRDEQFFLNIQNHNLTLNTVFSEQLNTELNVCIFHVIYSSTRISSLPLFLVFFSLNSSKLQTRSNLYEFFHEF